MTTSIRLTKAFSRLGITLSYEDGVYALSTPDSHARVLLPPSLQLEEKAVQQLLAFASVRSADSSRGVCGACATPDFHPGNLAPVGSIVATAEDFVIPTSIGTDINCGMRLIRTGIRHDVFRNHEQALIPRLSKSLLEGARDVPMREQGFQTLFDAGPAALLEQLRADRSSLLNASQARNYGSAAPSKAISALYGGGSLWARADLGRMQSELAGCIGLPSFRGAAKYAPEYLVGAGLQSGARSTKGRRSREVLRDPGLGSVGSGNHFVEFAMVSQLLDRRRAWELGLKNDEVVLMIHSGSRVVGKYVGLRWMEKAKAAWPSNLPHPVHGLYGLQGQDAHDYLTAMNTASVYAWLNRAVLTEIVRDSLIQVFKEDRTALIVDVPHNVVLQETQSNGKRLNIHRKGSTPAHRGELALIPGSMGTLSYLVEGLGHPDWFASCSHGAGRSVRRQAMHHEAKTSRTVADSVQPWKCVTLREERRVEEAPHAYKPIGPVIEAQEQAGLLRPVIAMSPLLTFKA